VKRHLLWTAESRALDVAITGLFSSVARGCTGTWPSTCVSAWGMLWIESALVLVAVAIALAFPAAGAGGFDVCERRFRLLAEQRNLATLLCGLAALAARAAVLPVRPIPIPGDCDEYGYLLIADTFAHGRLTNPTHLMWMHFESFHIIQRPTYTGMYYPAQGAIMALGQVITGHPFWGVWLSVGLMCAALCWMLQGWLPPAWALLGGLLAAIRLGTFSYWADSYWGGAVAATGGALVLGALPRITSHQRVRDALWMGLGFALIANSRPYEGVFFGLPVAAALFAWMLKKKSPSLVLVGRRVLAPLLLVLVLTGCAMAYYFWRTTGSPFNTPYLVNFNTYSRTPYFAWRPLRPVPAYHHAVMRDFYLGVLLDRYKMSQSAAGVLTIALVVPLEIWTFYLGPVLTLPLLVALLAVVLPYGFSWRALSPTARFNLKVCGAVIAGSMLPIWFAPHYAAPMTGAVLAVVLCAMRRMRSLKWNDRPVGIFLSRAVPLICVIMMLLRAAATPLHLPAPYRWPVAGPPTWDSLGPPNLARARTLAELRREPGRQLVIVRYKAGHAPYKEWVYNRADIDAAKVVWAHDMGPTENAELVNYFKDRRVWLVEADEVPPKLSPYPAAQAH
jgi:hypothetical protein